MKQNSIPNPNGRIEGLSLRDIRHKGGVPDFTGQLRCHIGYDHQGRDICIVIPAEQLAEKKTKYPHLGILGTV